MKITEEQFTAAMEAAVAERGEDYVYPPQEEEGFADDYHTIGGTCLYSDESGKPLCIIGVALSKIDPALVPTHGSTEGASSLLSKMVDSFAVRVAAQNAQDAQDDGKPWGEALKQYKSVLT